MPFSPTFCIAASRPRRCSELRKGSRSYQSGVRINEAFGDTVDWDLIPDVAIKRIDIVSSSPLYGLNALGGAMAVTMKNGFTFEGSDAQLSGGSFNQRTGSVEAGFNQGAFGRVYRRAGAESGRLAAVRAGFAASVLPGSRRARRRRSARPELFAGGQPTGRSGSGAGAVARDQSRRGVHRTAAQHRQRGLRDAERLLRHGAHARLAGGRVFSQLSPKRRERQRHRLHRLHVRRRLGAHCANRTASRRW